MLTSLPLLAQSEEDKKYARATALERSGSLVEAAALFGELFESDPLSRVFFDGVVRTYTGLGWYDRLRTIVERRIQDGDGALKTRLLLAELLYRSGDRKGASAAWSKALESTSKDLRTYDLIAESYVGAGLLGEAVRTYEEARRHFGRSFDLNKKLGTLYLSVGDVAKGVNEFVGILDLSPDKVPDVIALLAPAVVDRDAIDAARKVIQHHVDVNRDDLPYRRVLVWILVEAGEWREALSETKEIDRRRDGNGSELYAFADRMRRAGNVEAAIAAYESLIESAEPTNPLIGSARLGIALATREKLRDEPETADEEWSRLIDLFTSVADASGSTTAKLDAYRTIAEIEAYDRARFDEALEVIDRIDLPTTITEALALVKMRADIHLARGDLPEAVGEYRRFVSESVAIGHAGGAHVTEARLRLAELYLFEGKIDEGIDSLRSLAADPTSDAMNDAMEWLMIIEENRSTGDSLLGNYLAGIVAARRGDWEEVDRLMSRAFEADRSGTIADDALYYRAVSLIERGRVDDGRMLFERIVTEHATGTHADRALVEWARSFEDEGLVGEAERIYLRLLSEYPYSIEAGRAREGLSRIRGGGS